MAIKSGVPIVPVACSSAHRIMEKRKLNIQPGTSWSNFCDPIDPATTPSNNGKTLVQQLHDRLAAGLPPDQRPQVFPAPLK